jgi:hypothetical protein
VTLDVQGGPLNAGAYRLTVFGSALTSLHDLSGLSLDGNADGAAGGDYVRTFQVGVGAPSVVTATVGDGTVQRSQIKRLTLSFDRPVALAEGALTLSRLNTGGSGTNDSAAPTDASAALGTPTTTDGGVTWAYSFVAGTPFSQATPGGAFTGSLVDGIYTATVDPAKVTAGGAPMGQGFNFTFHRLFGDANGRTGTGGQATVNNADFITFRGAFGKVSPDPLYKAIFDFDNSGSINNADFIQFRGRYGKVFSY